MIYVKLSGGLGNQLFQYAAGYALANRRGLPLKLDLTAYGPQSVRRPDILDFAVAAEVAAPAEVARFHKPEGSLSRRISEALQRRLVNYYLGYQSGILAPGRFGSMNGYFQDERYFLGQADALFAHLRLRNDHQVDAATNAIRSATGCLVSVHVRRGDFVSARNTAIRNICDADYYRQALEMMYKSVGPFTCLVFSDDLTWVRRNLNFGSNCIFADELQPLSGPQELVLMSRCHHHIIANSTFSWWGAYLENRPEKVVVAPSIWANGSPHHPAPSSWLLT